MLHPSKLHRLVRSAEDDQTSPGNGVTLLHAPLLSANLRNKYRPAPFDALLVAVILVYRPLLRDETSYL